jgi:hypothetical protein
LFRQQLITKLHKKIAAKEASTIFHKIMKASVKDNPKPKEKPKKKRED